MLQLFYFWIYTPVRIESKVLKRYLYTHIHSSIIHNSQMVEATKLFTERSMDEQKVVYRYQIMYKSRKNEILTHATTYMKLEDIMLSEISQSQKDNCCMIPLILGTRVIKLLDKIEWWFPGMKERGIWELLFDGHRVAVLHTEKVLYNNVNTLDTTEL